MQAVLFVALAAGIFGVLPRLGGLTHEATGLRHARPGFLIAAIVAQAISLGCYAQLYRQVLAALGARIRFRLAADVTLATFFVSHLTPFGSATGTLVNVNTLEGVGIDAATTSGGPPVTPRPGRPWRAAAPPGRASGWPAGRVPRRGGWRPPGGRGFPRPCGSGTGPCSCAA